jgi:hypothetical protein
VALGLYQLFKMNGHNPSIFIMPLISLKYGLFECMEECHIKFEKYILKEQYEKAVVVSAYPTIKDIETVPRLSEILQIFKKEDVTLISHYYNPPKTDYRTICLSPAATEDHLILCENPFIENKENENFPNRPIRLLVQGNLQHGRKDFEDLDFFFDNTSIRPDKFKIGLMGGRHTDEFKLRYQNKASMFLNVREIDFYRMVNQSDFVLPLISKKTSNGTYAEGRWSNSLYHSFCFNKPMVINKLINKIYNHPSFEYSGKEEFLLQMEKAINIKNDNYTEMSRQALLYKEKLRTHNSNIMNKYFTK